MSKRPYRSREQAIERLRMRLQRMPDEKLRALLKKLIEETIAEMPDPSEQTDSELEADAFRCELNGEHEVAAEIRRYLETRRSTK
jgi:hypothetical protein